MKLHTLLCILALTMSAMAICLSSANGDWMWSAVYGVLIVVSVLMLMRSVRMPEEEDPEDEDSEEEPKEMIGA